MSFKYILLSFTKNFELFIGVHPKDLLRVKNDDDWLERFLKHQKSEVEKAHEMLWTSVTWRKENNINGIFELN